MPAAEAPKPLPPKEPEMVSADIDDLDSLIKAFEVCPPRSYHSGPKI